MASDSTEANIHRDSSASSTNLSTIQQDGPDNTSRAIRQLSDLVVELYDFSQTIPPLSAWDQPANDAGVGHQELGLDHVLKLSQRFIVILNHITVNTTQPATVPHPLSNSGPGPTIQSTPPLDQPCELLALSGYLRIVEIYHIILEHVSACAASRKRTKANWHIMSLPSLTVGTFTMESTSATQVLVLVTLIEVMMTRSRELIRSMVRARKGGEDADGGRKMFSVGEATLEGFRPKEEATLLLARRVRRFVAGFGHE
ncbi:hypothetical protein B0H67DRAFT_481855 [Lasiosphaeris hirsuta]|uniref:Uncharacterized protein n=1 Tax=Lasiosphaeris hirsuta TaxID=260670 RepID=A0AA40B1I1_9PEZI|nr:hypothetical protein B0H67DRAFT_481855 [Lasiosphaeris hirsuta]